MTDCNLEDLCKSSLENVLVGRMIIGQRPLIRVELGEMQCSIIVFNEI
jgi:hypothetical protein